MNPIKKTVSARAKRQFSLETKKDFCIKWMASGLGKREFCRINNIGISTFSGWCKKILPPLTTQEKMTHWSPVITSKELFPPQEQEQALVELSLPHHVMARVKVSRSEVVSLIQELYHAFAIIR